MLHKAENKRRLYNQIQEHLKSSPELRPFPAAVTRLVAACRDPEATNHEIEEIISCDPSLSVKVLRFANSPLFCPSREICGIAHAISLLGRRKVKSIAMSVAAANMFSSGDSAMPQRQQLWTHSVGCASVANLLAHCIKDVDVADAFLAGILHDVGKLLFLDVIADEYAGIASSLHGLSLIEEERFLFGITHQEIGLSSAKAWALPDEILAAIGWHHQPYDAPFCQTHASVIYMADGMAKNWGIGSESIPDPQPPTEYLDQYGLTDEQLVRIENEAREAFEQTMDVSVSAS